MKRIKISDYLEEHQIEEKVPYFGKARLYTLLLPKEKQTLDYVIPREIFHFITAIYINIQEKWVDQLHLRFQMGSEFQFTIQTDQWSHFHQDKRVNLINDPLFYSQFMNPRFHIERTDTNEESENELIVFHLLVEYAKILPEQYIQLHESDEIQFISQQFNQIELHQYKGICIMMRHSEI